MEQQNTKLQVSKDQEDTYYVTPSLQNVVLTQQGKFLDVVLTNDIGVWDIDSGRCVQVISGIADGNFNKLYQVRGVQVDQEGQKLKPQKNEKEIQNEAFFLVNERCINFYDLEQDKVIKQIPLLEFEVQSVSNLFDTLLLVGNGKIVLIEEFLAEANISKQIHVGGDFKSEVGVILENRNMVFTTFEQDEIYMVNGADHSKVSQISHTGCIYSILPLENEFIAVGHKQSIHIIDTDRNCIKNMLKGYNEEYISLVYIKEKNQLVSGTSNAIIRIWDLKKCRSLAKFGAKLDIEYHQLYLFKEQLMSVNNQGRRLKLWNIENPKQIKQLKFMKGGMKSVQKIVQISQDIIGMLLTRGEFMDGQLNFQQELEVVNIQTNEHLLGIQIDHQGYSVVQESFLYSQQSEEIFYLLKSENPQYCNVLTFQKYDDPNVQRKIDFNVEQHQKAYFFKQRTIVVPYNQVFDSSVIFGFSNGQVRKESGLSVYDFDKKLLLKIQFETEFTVEVVAMIDDHNLTFVNSLHKLEFWDLKQQKMTQVVELAPNIIKQISFIDKYYFLLDGKKDEFILWDAEDLDTIQRRKAKKGIIKIELFDEDCLILYENQRLELWNVETGEYRDSKISYEVSDFIVQGDLILLVGQGFMQLTNRNKL